jgi:hypothetical protein
MAVQEELEAILQRLQQMREQLLLIKADGRDESDLCDGEPTAIPPSPEPETAGSRLR